MLHANPAADVLVFAVWEPVLETDWVRPDSSITSQIPDSRVRHFWDRQRRLSELYGGPAATGRIATNADIGFKMTDVLWDAALVYPPGAQWRMPATLLRAPVFKFADSLFQPAPVNRRAAF